jgi:hypothetical protein
MYQPIQLRTKIPSVRNSISRSLVVIITLLFAAMASVQSASATTITVNSTADPTESGKTTLRDALASAADGDTINFNAAVTGTITLTSELLVNDSIIISGPGANVLAVNGNAASRVFHIASGKTVTISGLTITNGNPTGNFPDDSGGGIYNDHTTLTVSNCTVSGNSATWGGGIYNFGENNGSASLTVSDSTVSGNSAGGTGAGGGIYNDGENNGSATLAISNSTLSGNSAPYGGGVLNDAFAGNAALTVNNSTLSGNSASSFGGGIYNKAALGPPENPGTATLTVSNSTLSSNSATSSGGGIYNFSTDVSPAMLTISNSTLSSNSAENGAGIYNEAQGGLAIGPASATLTISNSTLSGNAASSFGGGIYNHAISESRARATITNSTMSDNSAANGGGIYNVAEFNGGAVVTIGETIFKAGASGANISDVSGIVTSLGYNLSSDDASAFLDASGDQNGTNPLLGPLQNNGGSTFTHALLTGSPAIDAGAPPLDFDQRGPNFVRVVNGRIDIGAFEVQGTLTSIPPAAPIATNATGVTNNNFTANWNSVSNATGYRLDVAKNSSFKGGSFVAGYHNLNVGNVTSRFVGGLSANTTYYFQVRAFNSSGVSPNSNVITVTTSP